MLQRAIAILQKEVAGGASTMQLKSAINLEQALEVVVKASAISVVDGSQLVAMLQSFSNDTDSDASGFDAAAYESHSGGIVGTLDGMYKKAEGRLDEVTVAAMPAKNNADLLKQSF